MSDPIGDDINRKITNTGDLQYETGCRSKIQHTEAEARREARFMKRIRKKRYDAYECRYCGHWHIGTAWRTKKRKPK